MFAATVQHVTRYCLSLLLVLAQLVQPLAAIADTTKNIGTQLRSDLGKILVQAAADQLGVTDVNPVLERAMGDQAKANATIAKSFFETGTATSDPDLTDVYDPSNQAKSNAQVARWKSFIARTSGKVTLSQSDILEGNLALLPFLRYFGQAPVFSSALDGNQLTLAPGQSAKLALSGHCMDRTVAAPGSGEKLQLVSIDKLIDKRVLPLYQAMMQYAALHVEKRSEIQNLVWGLRHAADPSPPIKELNLSQRQLLDAAMPGDASSPAASVVYTDYLAEQAKLGQFDETKKKLFRQALTAIGSKTGQYIPDPTISGYTPSQTSSLLAALTQLPVTGQAQENSEYSLLAPGVGAQAISQGLALTRLEIRNTSTEPFVFDASRYAGQSTRVTQRVAFSGMTVEGLIPGISTAATQAQSALDRLNVILQVLEIPALKRFQAQVQDSIDSFADAPGSSDLKLASLALVTAINQVLLPTTYLDVVGGKLVGSAIKAVIKDAGAIEKAGAAALSKGVIEEKSVINLTGLNKYADKPIFIDAKSEKHILEGEINNRGGHRAGTGRAGKSEFPSDWTDRKITSQIFDIATDSSIAWSKFNSQGYIVGSGMREGLEIRVVIDKKTGRIITGYPTNTPRNP